MLSFTYFLPTKIEFGIGKINLLGKEASAIGKRALLVVGKSGQVKKSGILDKALEQLKACDVDSVVFDEVQPNPICTTVDEGAKLAREKGCELVIGLGGGSPIDSAKCIAFMALSEGKCWDYVGSGTGGRKIPQKALPLVAVPTTAGTGTEADPFAVITNPETKEKIGLGFDLMFPKVSIVDPELTLSLPPLQTAYTGFDALYHAIESYVNTKHQPASDLLALESIRLISTYLPIAYRNPQDIEARTYLAWASTAAGMCETLSGCIVNHSLEHAVSGNYEDIPHGAGLIAIGPSVFEHLIPYVPERLARIAEAMGEKVAGLPPEQAAHKCVSAITKLQEAVGVGGLTLKALGVEKSKLEKLAWDAIFTMGKLLEVTPAKLEKSDLVKMLKRAYGD